MLQPSPAVAAPATEAVSDSLSAVSDNLSAAAEAARGPPGLRINTSSHKKEWAALERLMQGGNQRPSPTCRSCSRGGRRTACRF